MKTITIVSLLFFSLACKKNEESCPLQTYTIACDERSPDAVFGGYLTHTNQYSIQSNCPQDAQKAADKMSYDFGGLYKRCRVVP